MLTGLLGRVTKRKLLVGVFFTFSIFTLLVAGYWGLGFVSSATNDPYDVRVTNVTGRSFTVTWLTKSPDKGYVKYSTDEKVSSSLSFLSGSKTAYDDRDYTSAEIELNEELAKKASGMSESSFSKAVEESLNSDNVNVSKVGEYYVHHVTLRDLDPNQEYYFVVGNGYHWWDVSEVKQETLTDKFPVVSVFSVMTRSDPDSLPVPNPAWGKVQQFIDNGDAGEYVEIADSLVFAQAFRADSGASTDVISSVTNSTGGWALDKSNFRDPVTGDLMLGYRSGIDKVKLASYSSTGYLSEDVLWGTEDSPATVLMYRNNSLDDLSDVKGVMTPEVRSGLVSPVEAMPSDGEAQSPANANTGDSGDAAPAAAADDSCDWFGSCDCGYLTTTTDHNRGDACVTCDGYDPATKCKGTSNVVVPEDQQEQNEAEAKDSYWDKDNNAYVPDCLNDNCGEYGLCDAGDNPDDGGHGCFCFYDTEYKYRAQDIPPSVNPGSCPEHPWNGFEDPFTNTDGSLVVDTNSDPLAQCQYLYDGSAQWSKCPVFADDNTVKNGAECRCVLPNRSVRTDITLDPSSCARPTNECEDTGRYCDNRIPYQFPCPVDGTWDEITELNATSVEYIGGNQPEALCTTYNGSLGDSKTPNYNPTWNNFQSYDIEFAISCGADLPTPQEADPNGNGTTLLIKELFQKTVNAQTEGLIRTDADDPYVILFLEDGLFDVDLGDYYAKGVVAKEGQKFFFYSNDNGVEGYQAGEDTLISSQGLTINVSQVGSSYSVELGKGINLISFPFLPSPDGVNSLNASELLALANSSVVRISHITKFSNGKWDSGLAQNLPDANEIRGEDFPLAFGTGYLVVSEIDFTLQIPGFDIESSVPIAFKPGWNLVGLHGYDQPFTAQSFIESVNTTEGLTADNVTKWTREKGRYEGLQFLNGEAFGFDYPILDNAGYFMRISSFNPSTEGVSSIIWNPGAVTTGQ
ncbi:fibronectin type III domain-containing protein [Candidatus Dojkabacteria bacterium]|uniref:Fibronectin type III domain-containing protein n=1 Tax=Candidatus Dojkabacteria bacterium TaxID=2099670 RepID=A0A955KY46_9BACT|nr:fibronectin type III domain-containing protein [Candidatus Dojkabacteria bacterium]